MELRGGGVEGSPEFLYGSCPPPGASAWKADAEALIRLH
jgi:hypothetical protein